jgi:DNA-directed RNA polymerase subunit beta'
MKIKEELLNLEKTLLKLEKFHASFDYLKISIASPKRIKSWAERKLPSGEIVGEILRAETINFRTHQPEVNGLFCERIFGPIKNWKCKCGKYNGFLLDKICEDCQVEIIEARVRRYRMGYIELSCPVTHVWYLKGSPSYLAVILRSFDEKLKLEHLEEIAYYQEGERNLSLSSPFYPFFFTNSGKEEDKMESFFLSDVKKKQFKKYKIEEFGFLKKPKQKKRFGAELFKAALESIDLKEEIQKAREKVLRFSLRHFQSFSLIEKSILRRIRILESFLASKTNPSWLILTILPVLPPNLRPLLELENGRLVAADVNEIYRLIVTRNQRLFDFLYHYLAPDLVTVHARKLLQEGVDCLIDNARLPKDKIFSLNNKPLKSLTEILEGKQGRFRQSLLGKRVDYSGRSVIIVGPNLRLNQFGLPYEMAVELFQPFLIHELLETKIKPPSHNIKLANVIIKKNKPFIWLLLGRLIRRHSLLLNRAPTLHRFGIQAFDPVLVLGQAIHLHPLVCTGFNADFDGDQMAVHLPLYHSSQFEAKLMMRPSYNVISPSNGEVVLKPTQDMVIGCYYLTFMGKNYPFPTEKIFSNEKEAIIAYNEKKIELHSSILVRYQLLNLEVRIEKEKIFILEKDLSFPFENKPIIIFKIFPVLTNKIKKYFVLTSLGIMILQQNSQKIFYITDFFIETTVGRIIFTTNLKNYFEKRI